MNETVKIWLKTLINKEIDDVLDDIENRKIWFFGSNNKERLSGAVR